MAKMKLVILPPEARLWPGLIASLLIPIGLFIFGKSTSFYRGFST
jgi:DHA1 family multidrug resistance protein-like MFS transporter